MTQTATPPAAPATERKTTRPYRVLAKGEEGNTWTHIATVDAVSTKAAIRAVVTEYGFGPTYVAIADTSWAEETPKADPTPRIRWS